ncbi:AAA family ATPase [Cellulomonas denverensis]|uniref:Nuclease SbcCD subunit C n=1 Tax=Cellulomonas denverensis TaxID=264297 RepID=A0A7X6KXS5_9CELL|nr:AAA family ATPase [Cellulomonas denverensis]NKY23930.1 AAA family ATPase [Cellulomonas denverensis]GIG24950.1 nuclease SbcCD subunit C [Cellulomonas denverensis]
MRLHTLTLQAVGPFAGRYTVDFAALSAGGLFLLEGPTGAGKSTVIDAVVFALYGKVAAASASEDRLRSAFADEDTESVVDLCFETAHGVYRVRRTPAYDRAKKRGTGTVRQNATVKLWRLTAVPDDPQSEPVGEIVSTRLDEAGAELTAIIGLDRTQFVQTMVLPQGEFAGFLRAEPEHRRVLLQRIFGTEVYDRLEHRLDEDRRAAQREVEAARTAVQLAVERFCAAAGRSEPLTAQVDEDLAGVLRETGELLTGVRAAAEASAEAATAAGLRAQQARQHADTAAERVRRVERWVALTAERDRIAAAAERIGRDRARLDLARRAGAVAPLLRGWDEARERVAAADKELAAAQDRMPAGMPVGVDPGSVRRLTELRDRARDHVATLTRLVDLESGLDRRTEDLARLRAAADSCRAAVADLDLRLAARPDQRQDLTAALDAATALAHTLTAREQAWQTAGSVLDAVREHATVTARRDQAAEHRSQAAASALAAAERESALRAARLRGIAGELAGTLADGEPCPVCGAVEHPAPTALADGHVTAEQVAEAEDQRRAVEERLRDADSALTALVARVSALAERTGGRDLAAAEAELSAAAVELDAARSAVAEQQRCADRLRDHDRATEELRTRREAAVAELGRAEHTAAQAADQLDRDRAEVRAALDGNPTVAARQSAERSRAEAADAVLDAWGGVRAAREQVADWQRRLRHALVEQGFLAAPGLPAGDGEQTLLDGRGMLAEPVDALDLPADGTGLPADGADLPADGAELPEDAVAAARAGVLPAAEADALDAAITAHRSAWDRVLAGLAEPELAGIDATADLDADRRRAAEALATAEELRVSAEQASATAAVDRRRVTEADQADRQVHTAAAQAGDLLRRAAPVTRMARLAAGQDGGQGLSLGTYVLQRRFEDVVAAANDRLRQMSDGRFELATSHERETRSRRLGLAMRIIDHHSGDTRNPKTLSGGETFYVSLCLALGLADVVTAEAGGIELGTLFIDEGFGSLDPHTLDAVLTELGHLRAGGRVVGLVSHVEAMKSAIAERIAVRRRADGSSSLSVIAG